MLYRRDTGFWENRTVGTMVLQICLHEIFFYFSDKQKDNGDSD